MTIIDGFKDYIGTREYDGIVAEIQKWYYGYVSKTAWCATSESYFAEKAGVLSQLGGRNEGVWEMYNACKNAHKGGKFYDYGSLPRIIPKGAVVFLLRDGASHVTNCYENTLYDKQKYMPCLGGNQDDSICVKNYHMQKIQAVFVPEFPSIKRPTIYKGYKDSEMGGDWCAVMQAGLNETIHAGLTVDGSCGSKSDTAIRLFQSTYDLVIDGRFGPRCWAKLEELLSKKLIHVNTIPAGDYEWDIEQDGWYHIPDLGIWVK